jgi:transcriptional regulator with XRE-family HTH domain
MIRTCVTCGARLAADHEGKQCSPCLRSSALAASQPTLDLWTSPAMTGAIRTEHMGKVFRAYRDGHEPRLTQVRLAERLGIAQAHLSRMEKADKAPQDLTRLRRWAAVLGMPEALLWFSREYAPEGYVGSAAPTSVDDVQRRQFLKVATVPVGSTLLGRTTSRADTFSSSSQTTVEDVRSMTETFRRLDNRRGGGDERIRQVLFSFLDDTLEPELRRAETLANSDMFTASAELFQLAGWISYDNGDVKRGAEFLRQALDLAGQGGDDALSTEMLAGMSHQAAFFRDIGAASGMAAAARASARRTGIALLKSEAAVMGAHAFALAKDDRASRASLAEAEQHFAKRGDVPPWLAYFDEAYLSAKFAHTLYVLGELGEAEQFARRALDMSEGYERGRLFNTALLASIMAGRGDADAAVSFGGVAVSLARNIRSARARIYLADLAHRLSKLGDQPQVRMLRQQLPRPVVVPRRT